MFWWTGSYMLILLMIVMWQCGKEFSVSNDALFSFRKSTESYELAYIAQYELRNMAEEKENHSNTLFVLEPSLMKECPRLKKSTPGRSEIFLEELFCERLWIKIALFLKGHLLPKTKQVQH